MSVGIAGKSDLHRISDDDTCHVSSLTDDVYTLKGLAQAKIIQKSVILFRVLNMTIWCKHVHRLELQIFIIFVLRTYQLD